MAHKLPLRIVVAHETDYYHMDEIVKVGTVDTSKMDSSTIARLGVPENHKVPVYMDHFGNQLWLVPGPDVEDEEVVEEPADEGGE